MPQPRRRKARAGLEVQVKAGRVHVLAAMGEAHRDMGFVRALIGGKPRIAVDAEQRPSRAAWISHEMRADIVQQRCKIRDKAQRRCVRVRQIFLFVSQEPFALVVALQTGEDWDDFARYRTCL